MALVSREESVDATCCRGCGEPDHDASISPRRTRVNHPRNIAVLMDFSAGHHAFCKKPLRVLLFDQQRLLKIDRARIRTRTRQAICRPIAGVKTTARDQGLARSSTWTHVSDRSRYAQVRDLVALGAQEHHVLLAIEAPGRLDCGFRPDLRHRCLGLGEGMSGRFDETKVFHST